MSNREELSRALEYAVDGDILKFNELISSVLQSKAAAAIDSAKEVVADEMYNFSDDEYDDE